jgi:O-acetyl-ADP-ribose deacetylase
MRSFLRGRIRLVQADITALELDAIVNAANATLMGGGGVDGAIHRAAGPELLDECRKLGGAEPGQAKLTGGYRLPARHVIHAVGPVWWGGERDEDRLLESCYRRALELAEAHECRSIAFPAISTGAYRFPLERATRIALGTVREWLQARHLPESVTFCCYSEADLSVYERLADELLPAE